MTLEELLVEEANDAKLKEADAMLRSARSILHEAGVMRRYGIKVRAQAHKLRSDVLGVGWYAANNGDRDAWFS